MEAKTNRDIAIYEVNTWLSTNLSFFDKIERMLKELETRRDSLPPGFKPVEILQFLRASVNEIKRVTALNKSLADALKTVNKERETPTEKT